VGHEDQFLPSGLNASCRFGQATFAGTDGKERDALIPAVREAAVNRKVLLKTAVRRPRDLIRPATKGDVMRMRENRVRVRTQHGDGAVFMQYKGSAALVGQRSA
jgi:hypothetical protein